MKDIKITLKEGVLGYEGPGPEKNGEVSQMVTEAYLSIQDKDNAQCIVSFAFSVLATALATLKKDDYDFVMEGLDESAKELKEVYLSKTTTKIKS